MRICRIGIVAPSSPVPMVELEMGIERMRASGLDVRVHDHCAKQDFLFAGTDTQRADAFYEYATSPDIDVIWCARGGYGATRILPLLEQLAKTHGPPPQKLLVGYSDVTALHEFVRTRWNWATLHATMPGALNFGQIRPDHWEQTVKLVKGEPTHLSFAGLRAVGSELRDEIRGQMVGGNLTLWAAMAGTKYQPSAQDKIVFFEEVDEAWYRVDRMLTQIRQAGILAGAQAILLGDFKNCRDERHMVLKQAGNPEKVELRRLHTDSEATERIFGELGVPVLAGLPAGHGPHFAPLPLGAEYQLSSKGTLKLTEWQWP